LWKIFFSVKDLISLEGISELKIFTNALENNLCAGSRRRVNIDPGYILSSRFVLLSTKNFQHRIHIGGGIFAEMTLRADEDGFHACPWTFPDFRADTYRLFLNNERRDYLAELREEAGSWFDGERAV